MNMVACVDAKKVKARRGDMIMAEAFDESKAPKEAAFFKDPTMAAIRIYVNDTGRAAIERLATDARLIGIECGAPQAF